MNPPTANTKRSLQLAKQLTEFIPGCNPLDTNDLCEILRSVGALRGTLRADEAELEDYLVSLAERLVELIERHGHIAGRQALSLVVDILSHVASSMGAELQAAALHEPAKSERADAGSDAPASRGLSLAATSVGLRMMDQRKLGEILVSLSMLTPAQVENALRHQKSSGKRFGESLVELGFISKSALDATLRIQRRQKDTTQPKPPWA